MASLFYLPKVAPVSGGESYAGCKLYFYATGTSTDATVYTDSALTTAHAQPVVADSGGVFAPIYLNNSSVYRVVLKSSGGATIYDVDPVNSTLTNAEVGAALYPATDAETSAGVTISDYQYPPLDVRRYGALGDGSTNDTTAINAAISVASVSSGGALGAVVTFPTGTFCIASMITLPNRVGLQGANGRGTVIKPHSSFSASYMFNAVNGTDSMFGSWLRDFYIDARGFNMTAVVWAQAWQETCGMERVLIHFDGTTQTGFLYTDGYGGATLCWVRDCEIFSNSTYATVRGIRVNQVSVVGGFVLVLENVSLAGDSTNKMDYGVDMINDSLVAKMVHGENIDGAIIAMEGAGSLSADTITGSSTSVTDLIALGSGFTGKMHCRNLIPNGATGLLVNDDVTGRDIPATAGMVPEYVFQPSAFRAKLASDLNNVTGNGTEYVVLFDTEVYDYLGEYVPGTGTFTAARAGKYLLSCCLKMDIPASSTTAVVMIATTGFSYEVYRGSFANQRDASNDICVNGAVIADMAAGDTAYISVTVTGVGTDTADVLSGAAGSTFSGQWLSR